MENAPVARRKNPYTGLFLVWVTFSLVLLWLTPQQCLPTYYESNIAAIDYSELLYRHSMPYINLFYMPFVFLSSVIVGVALIARTNRWWLSLLLFPLLPFACLAWFSGNLCDG